MNFFIALALVNIACFLPIYLLNVREQPNPFAFIIETGVFNRSFVRHLYARKNYTDPWRINFDFTFLILLAGYLPGIPAWALLILAIVLTLGILEILYSAIMHLVFRRAPSLLSDLSLIKAGWSVARRYRYLFVAAAFGLFAAILIGAHFVTKFLHGVAPEQKLFLPLLAALLLAPCLYHWRSFLYSEFIWRVTYSPLLHFVRNLEFSRRTRGLLKMDARYFDSLNRYKDVEFAERPNIIILCIESYGGIAFADPELHAGILPATVRFAERLADSRYAVASNLSEAPIFAGGSWLSYTSLTYGTLLDDANVYDGLFGSESEFWSYESLFHILERNGYSNNLLCPLGGISPRYVNWDAIDRIFRPQRKFDFDSINYSGDAHTFFVPNDLYAAPDQYSLNYAYNDLRQSLESPFSLFFCTLNSHFPWSSDLELAEDWRQLNHNDQRGRQSVAHQDSRTGYTHAIRYQLDNLSCFIADNADDDLLIIAFGDHQPPVIAPEAAGKLTPVHVISRRPELLQHFFRHGFTNSPDLFGARIESIRHEGLLSLLIGAMNAALGKDRSLDIDYRPAGARLLDAH